MYPYSIKVWYFCKECTISFQKLGDFFEHKNRIHFSELQSTKCIVFEERIKNEDHQHVSSPDNLPQHFEPQLNEGQVICDLHDSLNINDKEIDFDVGNTEDSFECERSENIDNGNIGDGTVSQKFHSDSDFGAFYNVNVDADVKPAILSSKNSSSVETMETVTSEENIDPLSFDFEPPVQAQLTIYENLIKIENKSLEVPLASDARVQALQNPYIRLKRITSKEIEPYTQSFVEPNLGDSAISFEPETNIPPPATSASSYECKLCWKKLRSEPELQIHLGICSLFHSNRNRFCVPCNRTFCRAQSLRLHSLRYHGPNELMIESKQSNPLPSNSQLMSTKGKLTVKPSSKIQGQANILKSKSFKLHKCDLCSYSTWRTDMLSTHKAYKHLNERPFKCSQPNCAITFKTKAHLNRHKSFHSAFKPFPCNYPNCDRAFKRKDGLFDHEFRVHSSSTSFTRPRPSSSEQSFIHHGTSELVNQSNQSLPLSFNTELVSTNEKVAGKCSSSMQRQVDRVGIQSYKNTCDQRGYFSTRMDRVAAHKARKHSNKISFEWLCSVPNCGKKFETRSHLRAHKASHRGEAPFHCNNPNCDRVFKRRTNLVQHEVIHSSRFPFTCPQPSCEQSFKLNNQLTKHLREFHFTEPTSVPAATPHFIILTKGGDLNI